MDERVDGRVVELVGDKLFGGGWMNERVVSEWVKCSDCELLSGQVNDWVGGLDFHFLSGCKGGE